MRGWVSVVFLALLVPAPAGTADDVEGGLSYQFDADTHHDAPDTCASWGSAWTFAVDDDTDGMLVAGEDEADHIGFNVPAGLVGERLRVTVVEGPQAPDTALTVHAPECDGTVFASQNVPAPPIDLPELAAGEALFTPTKDSATCDGLWYFLINQVEDAPQSIHAAWTDGSQKDIPLDKDAGGTGHYVTTAPLDVTLVDAWAALPEDWTGEFKVTTQPCGATDGGAVFGEAPVAGDDTIWFTPVRSGWHVAAMTLVAPTAPKSVPMSCHYCIGPAPEQAAQAYSYRVAVTKA